ncbi:hypothetical protein K523DRAFT_352494 [Schizophyllum commune Tattone D]|nr:hypothetical protein K523DRAFT_352494 [Schizophyllum commune Tattone D]
MAKQRPRKYSMTSIDDWLLSHPSLGLRRFPEGRDFAQWTGDDSKALMKIYIAAIAGHVPERMVKALSAYLDFCFLARRNAITSTMLAKMDDALSRFYEDRQIFMDVGVRVDISLPRQHALKHYIPSILLFGSPNGLCSSITESKHIKAVKEPWRRSNRYNALGQMLTTNVRLDKMHAARLLLEKRGMMIGTTASYTAGVLDGVRPAPIRSNPADEDSEDEDVNDNGPPEPLSRRGPRALTSVDLAQRPERTYPRDLKALAVHIGQPRLPILLRRFLRDQIYPDIAAEDLRDEDLPRISSKAYVYHSAVARFYAPVIFAARVVCVVNVSGQLPGTRRC